MAKVKKSVLETGVVAGPARGADKDGFVSITGFGRSVFLGDPNDAAEVARAAKKKITLEQSVTAFLIGCKAVDKKKKGKLQRTVMLQMQTDGPDPEAITVFSSGLINWALLDNAKIDDNPDPKKVTVKPTKLHGLFRITYQGSRDLPDGTTAKQFEIKMHATQRCANPLPVS